MAEAVPEYAMEAEARFNLKHKPGEVKCKRPYCSEAGDVRLNDYCSVSCEDTHSDEQEIWDLEEQVKTLKQELRAQKIINAELHDSIQEHREMTYKGRQAQANKELWDLLNL